MSSELRRTDALLDHILQLRATIAMQDDYIKAQEDHLELAHRLVDEANAKFAAAEEAGA